MEDDFIEILNSGSDHDVASNATRSSGSELLSITEEAVKALDKPKTPKNKRSTKTRRDVSDAKGGPIHQVQMYIKNGIGNPTRITTQLFSDDNIEHTEHDNSRASSVGSKSTTASDVLIRSTIIDSPVPPSHHDISHTSRSSNASSFLSGEAKPVRVSSRRLKEIKSPFDNANLSAVSRSSSKTSEHDTGKNIPKTSSKASSKSGTANNSAASQRSGQSEKIKHIKAGKPQAVKEIVMDPKYKPRKLQGEGGAVSKPKEHVRRSDHKHNLPSASTKVPSAKPASYPSNMDDNPHDDFKEYTSRTAADSGYLTHKGGSEQTEADDERYPKDVRLVLDATLEGVHTLQEDSIIDIVAQEMDTSPSTHTGRYHHNEIVCDFAYIYIYRYE